MWFTLSWVALAHAGFIAPIISAISSLTIGGLAVGQFLLGAAFNLGLGLLERALGKNKAQTAKDPGLQADIQVGGDNPLSFVMGAFATAGQLEYVNTWGQADKTPNAYLTHVISLSDLRLHALTGLWVNDQKVTLPTMTGSAPTAQGWPVADFAQDGADYLWIKFYDGSQAAADGFLTSTFGGDPDRPWQADQIGRGVAYVIITARRNDKLFSGMPSYLFETDGVLLYDIRKDSSAGGSGAHRWNNPTTWEVSNNPAVHVYNIIRGIRYGDEWVYGGQTIDAYQLPAANWMAAANACDEAINLAGGGTEPRYRSGCQITVDQPPADVIESILRGCSGRVAEVGGAFKMHVGAPGAAVYSFTDEQIIVTEARSFDPFPGLEQTFNGAQASYPEPAEKWAAKDAPAYLRADL
ncbi:MAG: phage tail protein, partial [Mesorhizobium sp.]